MKNWETTKNRPLLIAKIGMEGGGINGYLSSSDKIIYYDVNPQAQELANKFAYMKLTRGEVEFKPGNPRINLKNEKANFDIIFIDLSVQQGDSAYLITKEALDLYKSKLKKDGIIIFNTTSKILITEKF
jgi:spermidine synthase